MMGLTRIHTYLLMNGKSLSRQRELPKLNLHARILRTLILVLGVSVLTAGFSGRVVADAADAGIAPPQDVRYPGTIMLDVDATDVYQGIFSVSEAVPVQAGELTLLYPKWIPAAHGPVGPINRLAGLTVTVGGRKLPWIRNEYDVYAFKVNIPQGISRITLKFQYLSSTAPDHGPIEMTDRMLALNWNRVLLYPAGHYARDIAVQPELKLPAGWSFGTALEVQSRSGQAAIFKPTTLNTLADSPVYAGKYFRRLDLAPGANAPVHMDIVADEPGDLKLTDKQLADLRALVTQAYRLFGSHHYSHYDWLFSVSDYLEFAGDEHHQSSANGREANYFERWAEGKPPHSDIAHEFVHSWNGKFMRPADLWTPNFNVPMGDSLLWVYEGGTQYWGDLLSVRSGMWTKAHFFHVLTNIAAKYARGKPGYQWRNMQDTVYDPIIGNRGGFAFRNWQLNTDYYRGSVLLWLAVDCKIRALTGDKKSLDDFAREFYGLDNGSYETKTYTFNDIVTALNNIVHFDWARFLRSRLDAHHAPLDAINASGWKLVFTHEESPAQKLQVQDWIKNPKIQYRFVDYLMFSIGLSVSDKGRVIDVLWNGPAFKDGVTTGDTLVAVNGRSFTREVLKEAIRQAQSENTSIDLLVEHQGTERSVNVAYHDGLQYPHLVRLAGTRDYLDEIIAPRKR